MLIQTLISCNPKSEIFWYLLHMYWNQHTKRSYGYVFKIVFYLQFGTSTGNGNFRMFLMKT